MKTNYWVPFKRDRIKQNNPYHGYLFLQCHKYANNLKLFVNSPQKLLYGEEIDHIRSPSCTLIAVQRYVMTSNTSHASLGATKTRWRTSCSSKELVKDGRFWRQLLRKKQSKQSRIKYQLEDFRDSICLLRNPFKVNGCEWVDYHLQNQVLENVSLCEQKPLFIKQRSRQVVLEDLTGFDNTGNVCLWPSEEVLAYYLLKHKDQLHRKAVCELGAGMTGLAGFCLAAFANPSKVLLTDGNEDCVENIKAIIDRNKSCFDLTVVSPQVLVWDTEANLSDLRSQFDFIISGDCLFFTNCHSGLLHVVGTLLKEDGSAILMTPHRKDTLDLFCNRANAQFNVDKIENYDPLVWSRHQMAKSEDPLYDEDIHYPVLLLLRKKTGKNMSQVL